MLNFLNVAISDLSICIWLNILDVQNQRFAVARCGEKPLECPVASYCLPGNPLCQCPEGHGFEQRVHLSCLPGFGLGGAVLQHNIDGRQSSRGISQNLDLCEGGCHKYAVLHLLL